nr:hypothetical protein [Tanacetum cinerariifolium]
MADPNITMEEYIRLEEEKARRQGRTFNWQTATYDKMEYYENEDDSFMNLKTEYPAIVFDDTSDAALSCEPMVSPLDINEIDFKISFDISDDEDYMVIFDKKSFSCKIIYVNNLKMDSDNENDKVNMPSSLSPEPTFGYIDDLDFFKDFENEFPTIADNDLNPLIEPSVDGYDEGIVHSYEQRLETTWGRAVNRVHVLDFTGLTDSMRQTLGDRLSMYILGMMGGDKKAGFGAYWSGSERVILDKGDLRDYWMEISSDMNFLGPAPSFVFIRDHVRRLCHSVEIPI